MHVYIYTVYILRCLSSIHDVFSSLMILSQENKKRREPPAGKTVTHDRCGEFVRLMFELAGVKYIDHGVQTGGG